MNMNQAKEPCEDCILLAMCVSKKSKVLISECELLNAYILRVTNIRNLTETSKVSCYIESLRKEMSVGIDSHKEVYFLDKYWISINNDDGTLNDEILSNLYSTDYEVFNKYKKGKDND
jgi:hypothetical protein